MEKADFSESDVDEEAVDILIRMSVNVLWKAKVKRIIDGVTYFGCVETIEKGRISGKILYRIRYVDGDVEHYTERMLRRHQIFYEDDYHLDLVAAAKDMFFADVVFRCDDGLDVSAHAALLEVRCPPLATKVHEAWSQIVEGSVALAGDKVVVEMKDVSAATLKYIMIFLYSEELPFRGPEETGVPLDISEVFNILVAARRFNAPVDTSPMHRLELLCESYLCTCINIQTVVQILFRSVQEDCKQLQKSCHAYMKRKRPISDGAFREQLCLFLAPHPHALAVAMAASAGIEESVVAEEKKLPCSQLGTDMERLWQKVCAGNLESHTQEGPGVADCVVQFGDQGIQLCAHRFVLAARSGFFRAAFQNNMKEGVSTVVVLGDLPSPSAGAAYMLLRFLYTGFIDETQQLCPFDALHLFKMIGKEPQLGGFLQVKGIGQVSASLRQRFARAITSSNAWDLLRVASALGDIDAKSDVLQFIVGNSAKLDVFAADSFNRWCPAYVACDEGDDGLHSGEESSESRVKRRRTSCSHLLGLQWSAAKENAIHREVLEALFRHMQRPP